MRTSHGVLGVGLLAALVLAGPRPAAAGDVNVIVSAHPKVRVIVGNMVPRHGLKAHPGVRVIAPKYLPSPWAHTRRHPVIVPPIDKGFTLERPHRSSFALQPVPATPRDDRAEARDTVPARAAGREPLSAKTPVSRTELTTSILRQPWPHAWSYLAYRARAARSVSCAGAIFSWCNLRCVYSQNWEFRSKGKGQEVTSLKLVRAMLDLQERGCHNVNLVSLECLIACIGRCCYGENK